MGLLLILVLFHPVSILAVLVLHHQYHFRSVVLLLESENEDILMMLVYVRMAIPTTPVPATPAPAVFVMELFVKCL
jgi:hypothetical protein